MIEFLVWLQQFRNPVLDTIVEGITITGEENVLLGIVCILYWCVNKRWGYIAGLAVVFSNCINAALKDIFQVPRPWLLDSRIIPIRQETATGYSFPSGHTQNASAIWTAMALCIRKRWFTILTIIMMALIAISRVYLSVHTPLDVGAAIVLAIGIALASYYAFTALEDQSSYWAMGIMCGVLIALLFFNNNPNCYKMAGAGLAFLPSYIFERKYLNFSVKGRFVHQVLKVIIGLVVAMGIRMGLGAIFPDTVLFDMLRYFLMTAGILAFAPWLFIKLRLSTQQL